MNRRRRNRKWTSDSAGWGSKPVFGYYEFNYKTPGFCFGTIVASKYVITAAHCTGKSKTAIYLFTRKKAAYRPLLPRPCRRLVGLCPTSFLGWLRPPPLKELPFGHQGPAFGHQGFSFSSFWAPRSFPWSPRSFFPSSRSSVWSPRSSLLSLRSSLPSSRSSLQSPRSQSPW